MTTNKKFVEEFKSTLPGYLMDSADIICKDIIQIITQGIAENGVEIRGYFSIKAYTRKVRNSIIFKDLSEKNRKTYDNVIQQLLEQ